MKDGFVVAQSVINLLEIAVGVVALIKSNGGDNSAKLWAFASALSTFVKTVLYFGCELLSQPQFEFTQTASARDFWLLFVLPSSFWVIVPGLVVVALGSQIAEELESGSDACSEKPAAAPAAATAAAASSSSDAAAGVGKDDDDDDGDNSASNSSGSDDGDSNGKDGKRRSARPRPTNTMDGTVKEALEFLGDKPLPPRRSRSKN
jgi:hypothetical protein